VHVLEARMFLKNQYSTALLCFDVLKGMFVLFGKYYLEAIVRHNTLSFALHEHMSLHCSCADGIAKTVPSCTNIFIACSM